MSVLVILVVWVAITLATMRWLQNRKLSVWKTVEGVVVELSGPNEEGYAAIVDFTTEAGKNCTLFDRWRTRTARYAVGQRVRIAYDPAKPSDAVMLSFGGVYFLRYVAISLALTTPFLVLAVVLRG